MMTHLRRAGPPAPTGMLRDADHPRAVRVVAATLPRPELGVACGLQAAAALRVSEPCSKRPLT